MPWSIAGEAVTTSSAWKNHRGTSRLAAAGSGAWGQVVLPVRDMSWPYIGHSQLAAGLDAGLATAGAEATGTNETARTAAKGATERSGPLGRGHRLVRQRKRRRPVPVEMSRLMTSPRA